MSNGNIKTKKKAKKLTKAQKIGRKRARRPMADWRTLARFKGEFQRGEIAMADLAKKYGISVGTGYDLVNGVLRAGIPAAEYKNKKWDFRKAKAAIEKLAAQKEQKKTAKKKSKKAAPKKAKAAPKKVKTAEKAVAA